MRHVLQLSLSQHCESLVPPPVLKGVKWAAGGVLLRLPPPLLVLLRLLLAAPLRLLLAAGVAVEVLSPPLHHVQ